MTKVNAIGLAFIKAQLQQNAERWLNEQPSEAAVNAYAGEVEDSIDAGNSAQFEIRGLASITGNPIVIDLADDMIDNGLFGRIDGNGNVAVFEADGSAATRIDANVYPVGSQLSTRHEHPEGIVLTAADAETIGLKIED